MRETLIHMCQEDKNDCGIACIHMIFRYYGYLLDYSWLKNKLLIDSHGISIKKMVDFFNEINIHSYVYKTNFDHIYIPNINVKSTELPAIAFMATSKPNENHYIVVYKIKNGTITFSDPNDIKVNKTREVDFIRRIKYFIKLDFQEFIYTNDNEHIIKEKDNFIIKAILQNRNQLFKIFTISLFISFIGLFLASKVGIIINILNFRQSDIIYIVLFIFMVILTFLPVTHCFFTYVKNRLSIYYIKSTEFKINKDILNILLSNYNVNLSNIKTGEIMARINDCVALTSTLSTFVISLFPNIIIGLLSLPMLIYLNFFMGLLIIISCIILAYLNINLFSKIYDKNYISIKDYSFYYGNLLETIGCLEEIATINSKSFHKQKIINNLKIYRDSSIDAQDYLNKIAILQSMYSRIINVLLILFGIQNVLQNTLTIGDFVIFLTISEMLESSIQGIVQFQFGLENFFVGYNRILQLFFEHKKLNLSDKNQNPKKINFIQLENLTISYFEKEILSNVNITFASQNIMILGESGSGKSSLAKCLAGLLQNYTGNIGTYELNNLTNLYSDTNIVYLSNDSNLFTGTIYENICMDKKILNSTLNKLCNDFTLSDYVNSLNNGLYEEIAPNHSNLSTGQKQKIALIRSIVAEPDILIIDEALSNIDYSSKCQIISELGKLNFIKIYITHENLKIKNCSIYQIRDKKIYYIGDDNNE